MQKTIRFLEERLYRSGNSKARSEDIGAYPYCLTEKEEPPDCTDRANALEPLDHLPYCTCISRRYKNQAKTHDAKNDPFFGRDDVLCAVVFFTANRNTVLGGA